MPQREQCRFRILSFLEEYLPEDFLDIVVGGEDVKSAKPSPERVLFALEHLGSTPQETLYIGDSTVDAETARRTSSLSASDDYEQFVRLIIIITIHTTSK